MFEIVCLSVYPIRNLIWGIEPVLCIYNITTLAKTYLVVSNVHTKSNTKWSLAAFLFSFTIALMFNTIDYQTVWLCYFDCVPQNINPLNKISSDTQAHVEKVQVGWLTNKWDLIIIVCFGKSRLHHHNTTYELQHSAG